MEFLNFPGLKILVWIGIPILDNKSQINNDYAYLIDLLPRVVGNVVGSFLPKLQQKTQEQIDWGESPQTTLGQYEHKTNNDDTDLFTEV